MAHTAYHIAANFATGPYAMKGRAGIDHPLEVDNQRIESIPALVLGNSFTLDVYCYADYQKTAKQYHDFGASPTTTKLYIKRRDSAEDPVVLDAAGTTAVAGQTEYWKLSFSVPKETITDYFAGQDVLIYAEVIDATAKRSILIETTVLSAAGTGQATFESSDMPVTTRRVVAKTTAPTTGDDAADNYAAGDYWYHNTGSPQLYRCDDPTTSAAVWTAVSAIDDEIGLTIYHVDLAAAAGTLTLPDASTDGATAVIHIIDATNALTLTGSIWGDPLTLDSLATAWLHWRDLASLWYNLNFSVIVE